MGGKTNVTRVVGRKLRHLIGLRKVDVSETVTIRETDLIGTVINTTPIQNEVWG